MYYGGGGAYSMPPSPYSASPYLPALPSPYSPYSGRIMSPGPPSLSSSPYSTRSSYVHPSRYTPMLSSISETPYSSSAIAAAGRYSGISSLMRISSPKVSLHSSPKYVAPRPIRVNTADIDVSTARYKRSLPIVTPTTRLNHRNWSEEKEEGKKAIVEVEEDTHFMPRCDENDAPPSVTSHPIKRDRTIVRISTIVRQRSKGPSERPSMATERGPPLGSVAPVIVVDVSNITDQAKRTWRDNFGEDLLMKPKEAVRKTPGELLLERHLIKSANDKEMAERERKARGGDDDPDWEVIAAARAAATDKVRRPSFHDICQEISSDKIESVDDLNAGELRRRASLLPDEDEDEENDEDEGDDGKSVATTQPPPVQVQQSNGQLQVNTGDSSSSSSTQQDKVASTPPSIRPVGGVDPRRPVNQITKSASGTLHCLLERHLQNNNSNGDSPGDDSNNRRKSVKRVHHKITAKVHVDEPTPAPNLKMNRNGEAATTSSPLVNATVEQMHHTVNHVVALPQGKKQAKSKEAIPKTISRQKVPPPPSDSSDVDFWGILGTRETVYYNKRRQDLLEQRQRNRLQTCTEDAEEVVQQFQESVPCELPQSPTVQRKENPLHSCIDGEVLHVVEKTKKNKMPKKEEGEKGGEWWGAKQTVAEKSERCEKDPKIDALKTTTRAKSPESGRVMDSSHEEEVASQIGGGVVEREAMANNSRRYKQTPAAVSSIDTASTTSSSNGGGFSCEDALKQAKKEVPVKKKKKQENISAAENKKSSEEERNPPEDAQVKKIKKKIVTKVIKGTSNVAVEVDGNNNNNGITRLKKVSASSELKVVQCEHPSGGSGKSSSSFSSSSSSFSSCSVSASLPPKTITTTSATSKLLKPTVADAHNRKDANAPVQSTDNHANDGQSKAGSLSKFATIENLNLLPPVDTDQPSTTAVEMAIEVSFSRAHKSTDPSPSVNASATAASGSTAVTVVSGSSESSAIATLSATAAAMDWLEANLSPKKKRVVVKRVPNKKKVAKAELSSTDVNIGNWSIMPKLPLPHHSEVSSEGLEAPAAAAAAEEQRRPSPISETGNTNTEDGTEIASPDPEVPKETMRELIRRLKGKDHKESVNKFDPQKCQKFSPDSKVKFFEVDEKAPKVLWATPRPLQKKAKKKVIYYSSDEDSEDGEGSDEETPVSSSTESEEAEAAAAGQTPLQPEEMTLNLYGHKDERVSSTCSNDSGFEGGTAPSSPKNMLGKVEVLIVRIIIEQCRINFALHQFAINGSTDRI